MPFLKTHLFYVIIIAILALAGHQWLQEHDARLRAEAQEKISETAITGLQKQMSDRDMQAQQQVSSLQQLVKTVKTPIQVVKEIPVVAPTLPVPPVLQPDDSINFPKADVLPLFQQLADGKQCAIQLVTAQKDLTDEKSIVGQKQLELDGYKKAAGHHGFFGKLWGGAQKVGLLGIGIALGKVI